MWRRSLPFFQTVQGGLADMTPRNLQGMPFPAPVAEVLTAATKQHSFYSPYWIPLQRAVDMGLKINSNAYFFKMPVSDVTLINAQHTSDPGAIAAIVRFNTKESASRASAANAAQPSQGAETPLRTLQPPTNDNTQGGASAAAFYQGYKPLSLEGYNRTAGAAEMTAAAQTHGFRSRIWLTAKQAAENGVTLLPGAVGVVVAKPKSKVTDTYYNAEQTSDPAALAEIRRAKLDKWSKNEPQGQNPPVQGLSVEVPVTVYGFAHRSPVKEEMVALAKAKGYKSPFWATLRQAEKAGTRLLPSEDANGVFTVIKSGLRVAFYNAEQFEDSGKIDGKVVSWGSYAPSTPQSRINAGTAPPTTSQTGTGVATGSAQPTTSVAAAAPQSPKAQPAAVVPAVAATATPGVPVKPATLPRSPLSIMGARFPAETEAALAAASKALQNPSPYWITALEAIYMGTEILPSATGVTVTTTGSPHEDQEYSEIVMYNAIHAMDPTKISESTCNKSSFFTALKAFNQERPIDIVGRFHRGTAAALMTSAAREYGFKSRYWITFEEAEAFDVAVFPDPCVVAVEPLWKQKKRIKTGAAASGATYYINADDTTNPAVFCPEVCRAFFPVDETDTMWPANVRRALQPHHFKHKYESLVYISGDTMQAKGSPYSLANDAEDGLQVESGTAQSPKKIVLYNLDQLIKAGKGKAAPIPKGSPLNTVQDDELL